MTKTLPIDSQYKEQTENRLERRIDMKRSGTYKVGDIVLVKWLSYPYWPARITRIDDKNVDVIFFGDNKYVKFTYIKKNKNLQIVSSISVLNFQFHSFTVVQQKLKKSSVMISKQTLITL